MKLSSQLLSSLVLAGLLTGLNAEALTLGRLRVLSTLGQPLVAEIEVPDISAEESNSLRVGVAKAEAFKSAGLEYNPAVTNLTVTGKRRADGRALLELRTAAPINEPFLDVVLEITWSTGRMVRDYTLLLDPQTGQSNTGATPSPTLPLQTALPPIKVATQSESASGSQVNPSGMGSMGAVTATPTGLRITAKTEVQNKAIPTAKKAVAPGSKSDKQHAVQKGDTAAAIAAANKSDGVSLDQMLVALLKANPNAFVAGNVNRLRAGTMLDIPDAAEASAVSKAQAKTSIQVQARDFNEYRRKLAGLAPKSLEDTSARQVSGKVSAKVDDKQPNANAPDKLTLSKPTNVGAAVTTQEDKIAKELTASDAAKRSSELQKNITDLEKVTTAAAAAPSSAPSSSSTLANQLPVGAVTPPSVAPAAEAPAVQAQATSPTPAPAISAPAPATKPPLSFFEQIINNPLTIPLGGGLLLVLGLIALLRIRKKRDEFKSTTLQNTTDFDVTRPASDTVFATLGANQVDTQEPTMNSTMVFPPSQLNSIGGGDVDPISEADVYLAYNRDVQAEEILKEAKANMPARSDVVLKLMEIYVKRRDSDSFDQNAVELHRRTDGGGTDWAKAKVLAEQMGSQHALFNTSTAPTFMPSDTPAVPTGSAPGSGLIDFDLSSLTLDLPQTDRTHQPPAAQDPKLALAEEYLSIGDKAGARALIQDVISHGSPSSIAAAQLMLSRIG